MAQRVGEEKACFLTARLGLVGYGKAVDTDGDFAMDFQDNCPDRSNFSQTDTDTDGVGSVCDNCPATPNFDQSDVDHDGIGDACDADFGAGAAAGAPP